MRQIDLRAGTGIAVREYPTDVGPADYVLFIDGRAVGVIEAKREEWGAQDHGCRGTVRRLCRGDTQVV